MNVRALVAEAFGTFVLVLVGSFGVLSIYLMAEGQGVPISYVVLMVPFTFGLGLLAAIAIAGHVSGGHFNPAVTLAALFDGRVTVQNAIGYVVAQIIGAIGASLAILLVSSKEVVQATVNGPGALAPEELAAQLRAFSVEAMLTAIFVAVILTITKKQPTWAILVIPLTLIGIHFAAIPISGASVNPARSLGPAVVSGTYSALWVYLSAPFVGATLGWAIYRYLTPPDDEISVEIEEDFLDDDLEDAVDEFEDLDEDEDEQPQPAARRRR
jgi:aquaporin Z